jgi:ribosomal protein S18 acetylase RimI-like enzyme
VPINDVIIRPFKPGDRAAVREICCNTADAGEPCESFFPDREVLADLVTRYYTDIAPQSSWVAVCDGKVVGYLTGSLDSRIPWWRIVPATLVKAMGRGLFWQPQFRRLVSLNWRDWLRGAGRVALEDYPAHFHINLRPEARGQQAGDRLVEKFFEQMRAAGTKGVHVGVSEVNAGGRKFFERLGFAELARCGRYRHPASPGQLTRTIYYGKRLEG